jgi:hypothetical protein
MAEDSIDQILWDLAKHLENVEVKGSFLARIWVGTGLQEAARIVERKRIEFLVSGVLKENDQLGGIIGDAEEVVEVGDANETADR